jgi:hypothetical protein
VIPLSVATDELSRQARGHVLYKGRPEWLDDPLLRSLVAEAAGLRAGAERVDRQFHCPVGPVGRSFTRSTPMQQLLEPLAPGLRPSGNANYLYYDRPAAGINPHKDSVDFPLQVLMMVDQTGWTATSRSALLLFPDGPDTPPLRVVLDPGEFVFFRASEIFHARSPLCETERVTLIGAGYR